MTQSDGTMPAARCAITPDMVESLATDGESITGDSRPRYRDILERLDSAIEKIDRIILNGGL